MAGVFFVAGVTTRVAFAFWVDPPDTAIPPQGGTAPINVANVTQEKKGGLYVGSNNGVLKVGYDLLDTDVTSRLKINGAGMNYGISVLGATQRGLFIDGQSTSNYGIYVKDTQGWGTYSASGGTSPAGGVYGTGGTYGVYGEGAGGSLIADTYAVYGKGASISSGIGTVSRYGVYGIAGTIPAPGAGGGSTYGVYAATPTGNVYDNTYALYVNDQSTAQGGATSHAAYIIGRSRIVENSSIGAGALENTLDIYSETAKSGLYVQQGNVADGSAAIFGSGGQTAVYGLGSVADMSPKNDLTYGVYAQAGNALNSTKSYGVYARAGGAFNSSASYALYGDTGTGSSNGKGYGLYVTNSGQADETRTAFFEDTQNINETSVEISSKSAAYGLKVVGGKDAVIYAEPRIRAGDSNSSLKAVYGKSHVSGGGEPQYGIYGEGADVTAFGSTYGVYGIAGDSITEGNRTYGVYGDAGAGSYGVYAKSPGAGTAFAAENEDHGFGYAAKFNGLVDLGPDGVFSEGVTFLNNYVFAATYNGALSVGTIQPTGKLTVEGNGQFQTDVSASSLWLTDQNVGGKTRYKLTVRDTNTDDPQLCIDIPKTGAICTEQTQICTSRGFVSLRATDSNDCEAKCVAIVESDVTCQWNCSGKIGYDDCIGKGTETSGFESCLDYVRSIFETDNQAPAANCFCEFKNEDPGMGGIKEYKQAVYTGGYDTKCADLTVAPK